MRIAVVVPSLTAPPSLRSLLASLAAQSTAPVATVVVYQGPPQGHQRLVAWQAEFDFMIATCAPGLSRARNAGIRAIETPWDAVAIPDDDIAYGPDTMERMIEAFEPGGDVIAGFVTSDAGTTRVRFLTVRTVLDTSTIWRGAMEAGLVISRRVLDGVGGFNENLGLGAQTPWQSGEGTEFLIRAMKAGFTVVFDPRVVLVEHAAGAAEQDLHARKRKARLYARGTGRVYRTQLSAARCCVLAVRSFGAWCLHVPRGRGDKTAVSWQVLVGRLEGLAGVTLRGGPTPRCQAAS